MAQDVREKVGILLYDFVVCTLNPKPYDFVVCGFDGVAPEVSPERGVGFRVLGFRV